LKRLLDGWRSEQARRSNSLTELWWWCVYIFIDCAGLTKTVRALFRTSIEYRPNMNLRSTITCWADVISKRIADFNLSNENDIHPYHLTYVTHWWV
jgi:hypothetical protein